MRLLTVGSLPPEWGGPLRGGAATFHAALLTALGDRADVDVVGVVPPGPLSREVPVPVFPRPEDVSRAEHYERLLDRLRPDVVLMNHIAHTIGVTHARLGSPVPAVGVIQSWHNITQREGEESRRAHELTQEALGGLVAMVPVSRHTEAEGRRLGLRYPPLVETIRNPVPDLYMRADTAAVDLPRRGVVFLGSLIERKRPQALVDAAAASPGLEVRLVGEGDQADRLRSRIDSLGVGDRVRMAEPPGGDGHLPWVRDALRGAEVMCLPSASEGLPLAFVESLACGTPVVGFGPALREIRDELGIDIGEPLDGDGAEQIAAAIERVRERAWDRDRLRRATLEHFGLDRIADRYVGLIACVTGSGAGAGALSDGKTATAPGPPPRSAGAAVGGTAICVLGPSRSGTSLTARLLALAGVHLGPEEELLGESLSQLADEGEGVLAKARDSNPGGHWEHYRLMRLNERILRTLGGSWREPPPLPPGWEAAPELDELREEARAILAESFSGEELWGWKDPRNSVTLPFWRDLLPDLRCVICLRSPLDGAASLQRRDAIALEQGLELWGAYIAAALAGSVGRPRLLVPFESFFADGVAAAARLARFAGRAGAFDGPQGERIAAEAIDERLWRQRNGR